MGVFEVNGRAERVVNYDMVVMEITFKGSGATSRQVSKKVMEECEEFLKQLEKEGISPSDFSLANDSISEAGYGKDAEVRAKRVIKLRTNYAAEIINRVRQLADESDYSIEFDLEYELSNEEALRKELLQEALLDSRNKAEALAFALGLRVVEIESVESDQGDARHYRGCRMKKMDDTLCAPCFIHSNKLASKEEKLEEKICAKWKIE